MRGTQNRLPWKKILFGIVIACVILILTGYAVFIKWPGLGAQGADMLRKVIGNEAVARLEMIVFRIQDAAQQWKYARSGQTVQAPWQVTTIDTQPTAAVTPSPFPTNKATLSGLASKENQPISQDNTPPPTDIPATPTPTPWMPPNVVPSGNVDGEGVWSPYIHDIQGNIVAYRTFVQPDPTRPYALVAVVAFDLKNTRLHFVLGSIEPYSPNGPTRTGAIPTEDKAPGVLLATFNGGFKATHGQFGAMSDGVIALPPKDNLGTLAIYKNGEIKMGNWGEEITPSDQIAAWRQNGPLIVHNGVVNPHIAENSPKDWGYTVDDVSPTWRSCIALSRDSQTLYYLAGPSLTMPALAQAALSIGAPNALQLDINNYWVHFVTIQWNGNKPVPSALFPDVMTNNIDRYLYPYTRDYFYVTAVKH